MQLDLDEPTPDFEARGEFPMVGAPLVLGALAACVAPGDARAVMISPR